MRLSTMDKTQNGPSYNSSAAMYPEPLREVFDGVPHQICEFHVIKELTKAILRAVAQVRKKLAAQKPVGKRGRPTTTASKQIACRRKRLQQKVADLFEHRHLFVQHELTLAQRKMLRKITRGLQQLRTLRDLMEEVYRLFDRRCRTDTAGARGLYHAGRSCHSGSRSGCAGW